MRLTVSRKAGVAATLVFVSALALYSQACDEGTGPDDSEGIFYGDALTVGNGTARSYVELRDNEPVEFGVALSEESLQNLPGPGGGTGPHGAMYEYLLPLPARASMLPYQLVEVDWNAVGHEPPGIYDLPHFDFHFYTITKAERDAIDPADANFQQKAESLPEDQYRPAGYIIPPPITGVPRMGVHWLDPASPELNGQIFTATFVYGSWNGVMIFQEPMITRAFLLSKSAFDRPVGTPAQLQRGNYMPRAYRVYWDEGTKEYRVALNDIVTSD